MHLKDFNPECRRSMITIPTLQAEYGIDPYHISPNNSSQMPKYNQSYWFYRGKDFLDLTMNCITFGPTFLSAYPIFINWRLKCVSGNVFICWPSRIKIVTKNKILQDCCYNSTQWIENRYKYRSLFVYTPCLHKYCKCWTHHSLK